MIEVEECWFSYIINYDTDVMKTCLHSIRILPESDGATVSFTMPLFFFQFELKICFILSLWNQMIHRFFSRKQTVIPLCANFSFQHII